MSALLMRQGVNVQVVFTTTGIKGETMAMGNKIPESERQGESASLGSRSSGKRPLIRDLIMEHMVATLGHPLRGLAKSIWLMEDFHGQLHYEDKPCLKRRMHCSPYSRKKKHWFIQTPAVLLYLLFLFSPSEHGQSQYNLSRIMWRKEGFKLWLYLGKIRLQEWAIAHGQKNACKIGMVSSFLLIIQSSFLEKYSICLSNLFGIHWWRNRIYTRVRNLIIDDKE